MSSSSAVCLLHGAVSRLLDAMWPQERSENSRKASAPGGAELLYQKIHALSPQNETQRSLQNTALSTAIDLAKTRWLMFEQGGSSVSPPLLVVLIFWLALIFCSFGLLAPRSPIVVASLCLCALSVSAAIFLVLEMYSPFGGVVQVSSVPLRSALAHLGK
jgi:FtsH-binding integral membrane protein